MEILRPTEIFTQCKFKGFIEGVEEEVSSIFRGQTPDFKRNGKQPMKFDFDLYCLNTLDWLKVQEVDIKSFMSELQKSTTTFPSEYIEKVTIHQDGGKWFCFVAPMGKEEVSRFQETFKAVSSAVKAESTITFRKLIGVLDRLSRITPKTPKTGKVSTANLS